MLAAVLRHQGLSMLRVYFISPFSSTKFPYAGKVLKCWQILPRDLSPCPSRLWFLGGAQRNKDPMKTILAHSCSMIEFRIHIEKFGPRPNHYVKPIQAAISLQLAHVQHGETVPEQCRSYVQFSHQCPTVVLC